MKAKDLVEVKVWDTSVGSYGDWLDITDGVLSINTVHGADTFEGFWEQADTGQFTITTRGSTADPNINPLIKSNSFVWVHTKPINGQIKNIFFGFITDVNVDYIRNQKQIVTINGTDLIGQINRLLITQDFIDTNITPTYPNNIVPVDYLLENATYLLSEEIGSFYTIVYDSIGLQLMGGSMDLNFGLYAPPAPLVKVEAGKTIYELISSGFSSALVTYFAKYGGDSYFFTPYMKYDPAYYTGDLSGLSYVTDFFKTNNSDPWQDPDVEELDPESFTFKAINMNNGMNKIINQVSVTNTNPITGDILSIEPVVNQQATLDFGPAKLEGVTTFTTTQNSFWLPTSTIAGQAAEYQDAVLEYQSVPKSNLESITVDSVYANTEGISDINIGQTIYIQHKIDSNNYIYGEYVVSGIKHSINESTWMTEYILRDSDIAFYNSKAPKVPVVAVNTLTGTTATTFSASISNYTTAELNALAKIEWMVNIPIFYRGTQPPSVLKELYPSGLQIDFSNAPIITGKTPSWNYDDLGPLLGYEEPLIGPGTYNVGVWVTNTDGYTNFAMLTNTLNDPAQLIKVTGATAHADFLYEIDQDGVVTFTDASGPDTNTWNWEFGDGTVFNGKTPPPKIYNASGTYNVKLTVNNGFNTNSKTIPVTLSVILIPVRWIKAEFIGTRTQTGGIWNKYLPNQVADFYIPGNTNLSQKETRYTATAGTVSQVRQGANSTVTPWDPVSGGRPYLITGGVFDVNNYAQINPQVSGNTETINVTFYIRTDWDIQGITREMNAFGASFNSRRTISPIKQFYEVGQTYEKIKIYVSDYNTQDFAVAMGNLPTWKEIGYFQNNVTSAENSDGYFYRTMTPIVPMPPRK
jgi:PKD repeat protein